MPILVDYTQVAIASVSVATKADNNVTEGMVRHVLLNMLLGFRSKYKNKFGELVICCDGGSPWRRDAFPYYKAARREKRKTDDATDWEFVFKMISQFKDELDQEFPYKVVKVDKAEGDDIIATLALYYKDNELVQEGLVQSPQPVLIVSSDHDFKQLHRFKHVKQFSPFHDRMIQDPDPEQTLLDHIIKGDSGDGVPNIMSQDDCFVTKVRQKPITENRLNDFSHWIKNDMIPAEFQDNFKRNNTLVNLIEGIPEEVEEMILESYKNAKVAPRSKILEYLIKHRAANLADRLQDF